ncbi:MAG: cytochrome c [Polyangiaceae bacterium]|nr:cytochrome c [Polyangiaceae bacterium]
MNYPVWDVPGIGAGLIVAIIAILHVLVSHIAVGGGAFLFLAELWARRQPDKDRIRAWLKRYVTFFLVYTTVFGAITGVGIWFSIQLASPEATSLLIHQFVFAWAIEWVAFLGELTVLYLYYYGWDSNSEPRQIFLAGAYFGIAWISLVVINGILTFMLTPGDWTLDNRDIAAGFLNPGYFSALSLRTMVMFLLAGLSAFVVAARVDDDQLKARIVRFASYWVLPAAVLIPVFSYLFWSRLPAFSVKLATDGVVGLAGGKLEVMSRAIWLAGLTGSLVLLGTLTFLLRPRALTLGAAIAMLGTAQIGIAGAEFFREMARKPYVVYGVLYSNSLWVRDATPAKLREPFLSRARWHPDPPALTRERGEWIYRLQCASCHTRDGYRSLTARTEQWTPEFGFQWLETMDANGVMPPFQGDAEDRAALVAYLLSLRGKTIDPTEIVRTAPPSPRAPSAEVKP